MSEQEPQLRTAEIARALGADASVYVGKIGIAEIISGQASLVAKSACEAIADEPNPLLRAVNRLTSCVNSQEESYSDSQVSSIRVAADRIRTTNDKLEQGTSPYAACYELYSLYFEFQSNLTGTTPGHILRTVGEDLVIDRRLDLDKTWDLYQRALEEHERCP